MERTLVLIKPDAVARGLVGQVVNRFEEKGLRIVALRMIKLSEDVLKEHYAHLADKPFYPGIQRFMMQTPVVALCLEGLDSVAVVRAVCGITNGRDADPSSIRGRWSMSLQANIVHASDSAEAAAAEIARFFVPADLFEYGRSLDAEIYSEDELPIR